MIRRRIRRALFREEGFTLVEVLIAIALLTIGIVGVGAALVFQAGGLSSASSFGLAAITRANYISTATMLAQERLEQLKGLQYTVGPPAVDQFGPDPIPAGFPDEAIGSIQGFPNFARQVRVQTGFPAAGMKTITVNVFFVPPRDVGLAPQQEAVPLVTYIAQRP